MRLPYGPVTKWNMTKLSDDNLQHEHELCYEVLNGIYYNGEIAIPGMLKKDPEKLTNLERDATIEWQARLQRAEDELERRFLLS